MIVCLAGTPKGICHTHFSIYNWAGVGATLVQKKTNVVSTSNFFHVGGFMGAVGALQNGQTFYHVRG